MNQLVGNTKSDRRWTGVPRTMMWCPGAKAVPETRTRRAHYTAGQIKRQKQHRCTAGLLVGELPHPLRFGLVVGKVVILFLQVRPGVFDPKLVMGGFVGLLLPVLRLAGLQLQPKLAACLVVVLHVRVSTSRFRPQTVPGKPRRPPSPHPAARSSRLPPLQPPGPDSLIRDFAIAFAATVAFPALTASRAHSSSTRLLGPVHAASAH